jgi:hypothetical protein
MMAILAGRSRPYVGALVRLAILLTTNGLDAPAAWAAVASCATEAAALEREESDLPRIEVTSPDDRPVLCITVETLMAFAARLKAHVAHCPNSSYAASAAEWEKFRIDYSKQFTQNRCRRTLPN